MSDQPFLRGSNVKLRFFTTGGKELAVNAKTWSVSEVADEGEDDVDGEDRSHPFCETKYFDIQFTGTSRDMSLIRDYLADILNQDSAAARRNVSVGLVVTEVGGAKSAFQAQEITRKPFKMSQGGRTQAVMTEAGWRARYFHEVQAA